MHIDNELSCISVFLNSLTGKEMSRTMGFFLTAFIRWNKIFLKWKIVINIVSLMVLINFLPYQTRIY